MARTALITGASSGIGMEFAGVFAREGYDLVLVARTAERLSQIRDALVAAYGVSITYLAVDLAAPGAPEALYEGLESQGQTIDVLVNNAGMGDYGRFMEGDIATLRAMLRLNVVVPTMLARLFGAQMVRRTTGSILNVASVAGFMPGPWMAAYFATKAQVLSLSEALAYELQGTGVSVTALCPGPVQTPFFKTAHAERSSMVKGKKLASPKEIAEYGYRAMVQKKRIAVPGLINKLIVFSFRFMPRAVVVYLVASAQKPQ